MQITKRDFLAYQEVQFSGTTNMFDVVNVSKLSNLSRDKIIDIMKNYSTYAKKWN
ncbi:MAG: hypothetical protein WCG99_03635 [Candidatus Berkelbacteria bacterium]